ncbi:MAG: hypothetical protein JRI72_00250 [Deltaproteobacteria bacterium]|nr:hypothetical protein [Deltaproteobacteria bacterium]
MRIIIDCSQEFRETVLERTRLLGFSSYKDYLVHLAQSEAKGLLTLGPDLFESGRTARVNFDCNESFKRLVCTRSKVTGCQSYKEYFQRLVSREKAL